MANCPLYGFEPKLTENTGADEEMQVFNALLKFFEEDKKFERHYSRTKDEQYFLGKGRDGVRITYQEEATGVYSLQPKEVLVKSRIADINVRHG
jgi:hypothetical protein